MRFSKKLIVGLLASVCMTTVYAAPKSQVFIGEFSMRNNNVGVVETLPQKELDTELSDIKKSVLKKHMRKYTASDLYIDFNKLSPWYKQEVLKNCNDGQICKITAIARKELNEEATKYYLIELKKVEVLKTME
jgi:hypothetical protein